MAEVLVLKSPSLIIKVFDADSQVGQRDQSGIQTLGVIQKS